MTRRILIKIEYNGGPFVGWQHQSNGTSVQAVIEDAARAFIREPVAIVGAGRTDAGVHAIGQAAHLDVPDKFTAEPCNGCPKCPPLIITRYNSKRVRSIQ